MITVVIGGAVAAAVFTSRHLDKEPMHMSQLTGQDWIEELLEGTLQSHSCINYMHKCLENVSQVMQGNSIGRWEWRTLFFRDCCMIFRDSVDFTL
jgi:hypothetical protein